MGETNDPCAGVDSKQVQAALDYLSLLLKDPSKSFDTALSELTNITQSSEVAACVRKRHLERAERIKFGKKSGWVEDLSLESWYTGPGSGDRFWNALKSNLESQGWEKESVKTVDDSSTEIVARLANPNGGSATRMGLVIGYVQSGKTTNFTSVIAKAADAGYRLFIVLSGMSNALREQTQARLESQLVVPNEESWFRLTSLDTMLESGAVYSGDFRGDADVVAKLGPMSSQIKSLAVVKKNSPRLKRLLEWLSGASNTVLTNCPVLIIDDESDQASVNTSKAEDSPTAINGLIRKIVEELPKVSYVGYTATPFANVLIDPKSSDDLYPRDFIKSLEKPPDHFGPESLFGREPLDRDAIGDDPDGDGLDMIREVPDFEVESLRPVGNDLENFVPELTPSLLDAVRYFWVSCAARRLRSGKRQHESMLVHTSMRVVVHGQFKDIIQTELNESTRLLTIGDPDLLNALRDTWEWETSRVDGSQWGHEPIAFDDLKPLLVDVLNDVKVIEENGLSDDRLNYDDEDPQTVIVVGGNTVARGLTLEGLCSSFFVRSAGAYDTLLQMGRWFGFRKGYEDLPRIWMTDELNEWFHHLATVEQEIRYDVERYETEGVSPLEFGPRLRTHPSLAITAASKMRAAIPARVSFSGRRLQTILFNHKDPDWLKGNIHAVSELLSGSRSYVADTELEPVSGNWIIRDVPSAAILKFLGAYSFHPDSRELKSEKIAGYIEAQVQIEELTRWSVAVMGLPDRNDELGDIDLGLGKPVNLINRSRLRLGSTPHANIKALMSKTDRVVDFNIGNDEIERKTAGQLESLRNPPDAENENSERSRGNGVGDDSGLLAIYPISRHSVPRVRTSNGEKSKRVALDAVEHVMGLGMVFPEAKSDEGAQTYMTADLSDQILEETTEEDVAVDVIDEPTHEDIEDPTR